MTTDRDFDSTAYGRGYEDGKRDAADEIARLRAGGCARDQGLTQYCAEAAAKDAEITALKAEVERLRAALEAWDYAVRVNLTMEGPSYAGVSSGYGKKAWELTRAALTPSQEPRT